MAFKFWKKPEDRAKEEFEKAVSLRNQGKWKEAAEHFKGAEKFYTDANYEKDAKISSILSALYYAVDEQTHEKIINISKVALSLDSGTVLKIPRDISAGDLALEARLLGEETRLRASVSQIEEANEFTAQECEKLATEMFSLGRPEFMLSGFISSASESPFTKGNRLMGLASTIRGNLIVYSDPIKAIDHFSQATGYFRSGAISEQVAISMEEVSRKVSKVAKCWFCGRVLQGEDYHFVYLDAMMTPYTESRYGKESPFVMEEAAIGNTPQRVKIVACISCSSAINIIADRIAKMYYDKAIEKLMEVRDELLVIMERLEERISRVEAVAHRH